MIEWTGFAALAIAAGFIMYLLGVIAHGHRRQRNMMAVIVGFVITYCVVFTMAVLDISDVVGNFGFLIAIPIILGLVQGWRRFPRIHDKRFSAQPE